MPISSIAYAEAVALVGAAPLLCAVSIESAGDLFMDFFSLCAYAFYLFSGLALIIGALRLHMGDTGGFAKCMGGAAMLCLTPYFASEISSLFNI